MAEGVSEARSHAIDQASDEQETQSVGSLKNRDHVAVVDLVPAEVVLQRALQDADHLAVHVVLGDAEEQESADDPAEAADLMHHAAGLS